MRIIYKINAKKPKVKKFKKVLTHKEAIELINNAEQLIATIQEQFKLCIFTYINVSDFYKTEHELFYLVNNPDDTISELVKQVAFLEDKIGYAKKFITKIDKTLSGIVLPYKEPSETYKNFLDKIMKKNRLAYLPIEFS